MSTEQAAAAKAASQTAASGWGNLAVGVSGVSVSLFGASEKVATDTVKSMMETVKDRIAAEKLRIAADEKHSKDVLHMVLGACAVATVGLFVLHKKFQNPISATLSGGLAHTFPNGGQAGKPAAAALFLLAASTNNPNEQQHIQAVKPIAAVAREPEVQLK